eukprot:1313880-Pyramimonas_sp.AAC.1
MLWGVVHAAGGWGMTRRSAPRREPSEPRAEIIFNYLESSWRPVWSIGGPSGAVLKHLGRSNPTRPGNT